jgi:hypothetical protein
VLAGVDGVRIAGAVPSIRMGPGGGLAPVASPDSPCPPDADIDVASWSDGRPFADQLADLRRASFGEVDKPEPTVTAALVRLYLHLGFGAEAAMLLADDPDPAGDHGWLQAIAGIVEGKPGPYPVLEGWRGCTGDAALWAALATPLDQVGGPFPSGVRRGFARLPPHLRQILADPLAARAAAANDGALASSVMLATRRLQPLKQGEKVAELLAALRAGGADTVETALALVHAAATARSALPPEIPDGLRVLADEQTDPVRADDLRKAALVASLVNGDVRPVLADPDLSRRTSALWALMHATTEDVDFISVASTVLPDADAIAALDRTATAARALDLGFPEIAQRWLAGSPEGDPAARLLQARVAIALGDFRGAQELVDGSPAAEAVEIAALAAEGLQQHAEAAALWVTLDQPERSARAARLAGEPGSDSPAWAATATSANGAVRPPTAAGVGPLAAGAALVSESQALRAAIAEMVSPAD